MGRVSKKQAMSSAELSALFTSMSMVLDSGVTVNDCLSMMVQDAEDSRFKRVLESVEKNLLEEYFLYKAMEKTGGFPEYALGMIEVGETSGRLAEVLASLGDYYLQEDGIKKQAKSAVLSPLLLIAMMAVVVLFLVYAIMPVFKDVFRQLGVDLSGASGNALAFQAGNVIMIVVGVVLVLLLGCVLFYVFSPAGKRFFNGLAERFVATRDIFYRLDAARFMGALSILMTSGIAMEQALGLARQTVSSQAFGEKIDACRTSVEQGEPFEEAVLKTGLLKGVYAKVLMGGSKSGSLDRAAAHISKIYFEEAQDKIDGLIAVIEPALVSLLSIAIGAILVAILLPLIGIMSNIG